MKFIIKLYISANLIWFLGFIYFISLVPKEHEYDIADTDAIIVLTGGAERVDKALTLLKKKNSQKLFITGIDIKVHELSEVSAIYSSLNDDDKKRIEIGYKALDTEGNALEAKQWVEKNDIKSITIVTASYHMPRSLMEFKKVFPKMKIIEYPVFPEKFKRKKWWRYQGTTLLLFKEYNKSIYFIYMDMIQDGFLI